MQILRFEVYPEEEGICVENGQDEMECINQTKGRKGGWPLTAIKGPNDGWLEMETYSMEGRSNLVEEPKLFLILILKLHVCTIMVTPCNV